MNQTNVLIRSRNWVKPTGYEIDGPEMTLSEVDDAARVLSRPIYALLGEIMESLRTFLSGEVEWVDQWMPTTDHITIEWSAGPMPLTVAHYLLPKYDPDSAVLGQGVAGLRLVSDWTDSVELTWLPVPGSQVLLRRLNW